VCVYVSVSLVIRHVKRTHRITLPSVVWPALHFSTLSHKPRFSKKKSFSNIKCVLISSIFFFENISHSNNNWTRYYHKYAQVFTSNTRYTCQMLMNLEKLRQIFEKCWNIMFHENPCRGSRVVPRGRMDRLTDMTTPVAAFRKFPNAPENEDEKVPRKTERTEMVFRNNKTEKNCLHAGLTLCFFVLYCSFP
jgi:hypothetical protein